MKIAESGENYLETILLLSSSREVVRSVDVALELGFSKPSVSRAMGILKTAGLVSVDPITGGIVLTKAGQLRAQSVLSRHEIIGSFLSEVLGVETETAQKDACRIEHIISEETFAKMSAFLAEKRGEAEKKDI